MSLNINPDQDIITQMQSILMGISQMMYTGIGVLQRDGNLISVNPKIPVTEWTAEEVNEKNKSIHSKIKEIMIIIIINFLYYLFNNLIIG